MMMTAQPGSRDPGTGTLLPLNQAFDAATAGRKAAALAALQARGFPVPHGWVVPASLAHAIAHGHRDPALRAAICGLPTCPMAVRSSGIAEDGDDASFAGQYESLLNVRGADPILDAIGRVWHSGQTMRLRHYADALGADSSVPTAILIQPMLAPDVAGVAFSANPVTGERDEVVINAVAGLGDRLMAGEVDADAWSVRGEVVSGPDGQSALSVEQARAVAALARAVEAAAGTPQDIEWAYERGALWLLQARPITALPVKPDLPPLPPGTWMKESEHFSGIVSVAFASAFPPAMEEATRRISEELGLLWECDRNIDRAGELYYQSVPLDEKYGPSPPGWVLGLLVRVMPSLRARMKRTKAAIDQDLLGRWLQRWHDEWKAEMRERAESLISVNLGELDDAALASHLAATRDFHHRGILIHFYITMPVVVTAYELTRLARDLFNWTDAEAIMLIAASASASSDPTRALEELATFARERPDLANLLADPDVTLTRIERVDPDFGQLIAEYLERFGHRPLDNDVAAPTLYERPELALGLIQGQLNLESSSIHVARETQRQQRERAEELLQFRPLADRTRFARALRRAEDAYASREDNIVYTLFYTLALMRYALLEAGARLERRGVLSRIDDIFFFGIDEVIDALRTGNTDGFTAIARQRRAERAWTAAHPGPPLIGGDGADMDVDIGWLPEPARSLTESFLWFVQRHQPPADGVDGNSLIGTGVSPGRHRGPVRIIRTQSDFHALKPGDVLVCPVTTSAWGVLFGTAGALVTDHGGMLSHPSIAAREHGIPAVVGTGDATDRLHNGQMVLVDGSTGQVEILDSYAPEGGR